MTKLKTFQQAIGPFRAEHLPEGAEYELSMGHPILMPPAGGRHGQSNAFGALALGSDPKVTTVGIDVGHELSEHTLRAPDVSVGNVSSEAGWSPGAPMLAVEYADKGTDEADLQTKVRELLDAGTKFVWIVRLVGPRRVEVYEANKAVQKATASDDLHAEGVLENSIPVQALYDRGAAMAVVHRNLLAKSTELREEAHSEGKAEGIAEGIAKGKAEGEWQALIKAIEIRVGKALTSKELLQLATHKNTGLLQPLWEVVLAADRSKLMALFEPPPTRKVPKKSKSK